jgi:hypothetical protein
MHFSRSYAILPRNPGGVVTGGVKTLLSLAAFARKPLADRGAYLAGN